MAFIGNNPTAVPLTGSQIADGTIVNANVATNTLNLTQKVTSTLPVANGGTGAASATAYAVQCGGTTSTGVLQSIASVGTSGQVLTSNGAGTLPTFQTASTGAMAFLAETSASNAASVDLNGYFTSTYDYYQIYLDDLYGSTSNQTCMQFATTGSYTVQTSSYYSGNVYAAVDSTTSSATSNSYWNQNRLLINAAVSTTSTQVVNMSVIIYNPMGSNVKTYTTSFTCVDGNIADLYVGSGGGRWNSTTAITGVRFLQITGNITARKIRMYGIKNS